MAFRWEGQALAIGGAYRSPEFQQLADVLDRQVPNLGRWRVIQQERQSFGP